MRIRSLLLLAGLIALIATPAFANHVDSATVNPTCSSYTITLTASELEPFTNYTIDWTISGLGPTINDSLSFQSTSTTFNSGPITRSIGPLSGSFTPSGTATLETQNTISISFSPASFSCPGPKPPPLACITAFGTDSVSINDSLDEKTVCIVGNVGTASTATGALYLNKCLVDGNIDVADADVLSLGSHGDFDGSLVIADQTSVSTAMNSLSSSDQALAPNLTLSSLTSNRTFTNPGGTYVINITGAVNLNGNRINFVGNSSDNFVINVAGNSNSISQSNISLSGGITPDQVLFNFTGQSGCSVEVNKSNSTWNGIILAPRCDVRVHNPFPFVGEVYGATVKIDSAAVLKAACK